MSKKENTSDNHEQGNSPLGDVRLSLTDLEREFRMYGEYLNQCINEKGVMTYPEIQAATRVWMETRKRFSIGNEA
jgi:hypothetical protein